MENIMLLILGVFISVMGIINIKGNISTIHSYNRRKVKEEDVPKYGKAVGTGTLIIGISLVLRFIVSFWSEEIMGLYCQQLLSDYALCCMAKLNIIKAFFEERKL